MQWYCGTGAHLRSQTEGFGNSARRRRRRRRRRRAKEPWERVKPETKVT
jgi:hypothetical protein